jgi:Arc/MetJ-type ribon-helix-helix transcriptional regulator
MTPNMDARLQIFLPKKLAEQVKKAAAKESRLTGDYVSMSRWIREAVRQRLAAPPTDAGEDA